MYALTIAEALLHQALDRAAAFRREAAARQARAKYLCIECHGPDGEHVSECGKWIRRSNMQPYLIRRLASPYAIVVNRATGAIVGYAWRNGANWGYVRHGERWKEYNVCSSRHNAAMQLLEEGH